MTVPAIRFAGVGKAFAPPEAPRTLAGMVRAVLGGHRPPPFWALDGVDFEIAPGEAVGLVGRNGSGKSTALKLACGLMAPTRGEVTVNGRISALLELGAGFHPQFSGRENVYLNASLLGIPRAEVDRRFEAIAAFADLGDFLEAPLRTYSSGMTMRLAFAVAVNVDPDILLVDEVLAVGDAAFQRRCYERIGAFKAAGKTLVLVSHDAAAVRMLCDRAIWLEGGRVAADGEPGAVLEAYTRAPGRGGDDALPGALGAISWEGGEQAEDGAWWAGAAFRAAFDLDVPARPDDLYLALKIIKSDGVTCYATGHPLAGLAGGARRVTVHIPRLELLGGGYTLELCVMAGPLYLAVRQHAFRMACREGGDGIAPLYATFEL